MAVRGRDMVVRDMVVRGRDMAAHTQEGERSREQGMERDSELVLGFSLSTESEQSAAISFFRKRETNQEQDDGDHGEGCGEDHGEGHGGGCGEDHGEDHGESRGEGCGESRGEDCGESRDGATFFVGKISANDTKVLPKMMRKCSRNTTANVERFVF